jgi:SIR2-like domain
VPITFDDLLPSLSQSLNGIGFLFGAGTSFQAGYPLMSTLTRHVVLNLSGVERTDLDTVLGASGEAYDDSTATPNIEEIADLTIAHALNSGEPRFAVLEHRLRQLIVEDLLSVSATDISHHVKFFQALKRRTFGLPTTVWIFTTNYDVLLETAAAVAGVRIENGFSGAITGFFDPGRYGQLNGIGDGQRFTPYPGLVVKLLKLHGSLSWYANLGQVLEQHPSSLTPLTNRVVVLPRRRKVMDTLNSPFDQLFAQATRAIGHECRYLLSCGFSFGDEHISQTVLLPALQSGRCKLTALCDVEPSGLLPFKSLPTFRGHFSANGWADTAANSHNTTLWRFSELAAAF